jgi:signal transduction histidine kinase
MSNIIFGTEIAKVVTMLDLELQLKSEFNIKKAIDACVSKGIASNHDNLQYGIKSLRTFIAPVFSDSKGKESLGAVILVEDISEAKAVERSRDEFFSIASHELRTPLTAIRGNTRMIIDYYGDQLKDPMLAEMVDDIHSSSIRLITIVNDFLDTSRLEQGKINFEFTSFSINELVKDISQEFKAGEINPNLYVKIDSPVKLPLVLADRDRLKQTIINMVGNAFKFTDEGGVTVTLRADAKKMSIEVSDTGKGIPLESQNLLFRKFQQASNNILTRDSTRSTGLGLYISKLLVEGMNGKIYLKSSKVGKGSVFAIEIPISSEKAVPKK